MKTKTIVLFFLLHLINTGAGAAGEKTKSKSQNIAPPFITENDSWVDSVYQSLTVDEKLGQLFMVAAYSNKDSNHVKEIASLVADYHIGGLIFMQGGPVRQAKLTNYYQSLSVTPLMISIDGEWGLSMRLDSTMSFPKQMALGAIKNDSLIYLMGQEIARQCKRIGVTINFAPDIDINNNAANPVIGMRSFGENKDNVARKGIMYMQGLQSERVFTTGKHFPGHGDTDVDSHLGLPVVNHPRQRLDTLEMYPFKKLIEKGLAGMMVAHMQVNSIDKRKNTPTTLSRPTIT